MQGLGAGLQLSPSVILHLVVMGIKGRTHTEKESLFTCNSGSLTGPL